MNPVLLHYASGSCTAAWLRMSRQLESEDFAPLGIGPLLPEFSPMRSAGDRAPVGATADEVRQLDALIPLSGPDDGRSYSGEGSEAGDVLRVVIPREDVASFVSPLRAPTEWSEEFPPEDITGQMVP